MQFNNLKFERKVLPKSEALNEERPYIDFIIDNQSLAKYLGNVVDPITPFGWGNNIPFELENAKSLITFDKSEFDNGLYSAYVCACCGDEGCGAIMFDIVNHGAYVEWNNFVHSDGYPTASEPDEKIEVNPFFFAIGNYHSAINYLQKMIPMTS